MTSRTRWTVVALALAGASCLALAILGGRWWAVADVVAIGPTGTVTCFGGGECRTTGLDWLGGGDLWRRAAAATIAGSLLAAFALVALAGALAARRRGALAAGVTLTATLAALAAGAVFVATFPGTGALGGGDSPTLGRGVALFAGGAVVALAASVLVLRRRAT